MNPDAPALKARFTSGTRLLRKHGVDFDERYVWGLKRTDAIDSRLQCLLFEAKLFPWGDAPGFKGSRALGAMQLSEGRGEKTMPRVDAELPACNAHRPVVCFKLKVRRFFPFG